MFRSKRISLRHYDVLTGLISIKLRQVRRSAQASRSQPVIEQQISPIERWLPYTWASAAISFSADRLGAHPDGSTNERHRESAERLDRDRLKSVEQE
jgi:hypothetical protein